MEKKSFSTKEFDKLLRVVKLISLTLFFLNLNSYSAYCDEVGSQHTKLTLNLQNVTLKEVFKEIESRSDYIFFYQEKHINSNHRMNVQLSDKSIDEILSYVLNGTNNTYTVLDRQIIIGISENKVRIPERNSDKKDPPAEMKQPQKKEITGKVTDEAGLPLPGVSILIKGTSLGSVTDVDGKFLLAVPSDAKSLLFSFVGMKEKEVALENRTNFDILLEETTIGLGEVVAVGYGELSRSKLTNSISQLNTKVLENATYSNVGAALQGTIPGLRVINTTGQPGDTPDILLRGGASISSAGSPLVLIDGVIGALSDINSNDIQSIDVLKDAASTAIYGARANRGVILITTKKGKPGKTEMTYSFKGGMNFQRNDYNLVTAEEYIYYARLGHRLTNESRAQGGVAASNPDLKEGLGFVYPNSYDIAKISNTNRSQFQSLISEGWEWMLDPYTNNQDTIVFKDHTGEVAREAFNSNPFTQDHNITFSGGNERSKFASSLNYYNEEGLSKNTMYERFSGKLNSSYRLKDNFEILGGVTYSNSSTNNFLFAENFLRARFMRPTFRPYDDEGNPNPGASRSYGNPEYYEDKYFRPRSSTRLYLNSGVVWEIVPDLIFKLNGSMYDYESQSENFQKKLVTQTGSVNVTRPADASISKNHQLQHNVTLDYKKNINKHSGSILVGGEYYYLESFDLSAGGNGAPTDDIYTLNAIVNRTSISSSKSSHRMLSGFSRLNYSYDDRFLFTAVLRSDGTSTLGDYKWGVFPGMSAGWNVHNESFFKETGIQKYISLLKPRFSYGVNGNISGISTYEVQGIYAVTTNYNNTASYLNTGLINRKLRWEKSKSLDVGLEMGLLDNRVTLNLNFFRRVNSDLLTNLSLPDYTGFSSIRTNLGNLENKGFEGDVQINILNSANGLRWDFGFNSAFVKNKILKLPYNGVENNRQGGQEIFDPKSNKLIWVGGYQEGRSLGDIVAYKCERILKDWNDVKENVPDRYDAVAQLYGPEKYATLSGKEKSGKFPIEPGDVLWKDFDKNDTIDSRDRYVVGNVYPKWTGGFTSTFTYKDFSLVARFDFALGHTIYNHFASMVMGNYVGSMNIIDWVYDSWSPENPDAKYPVYLNADLPKLNYKRGGATADADSHNSLFYEKGDYLAVRELTLGYRLPKQLISKIGLASAQLNLTGKNLAYITKFSGWNPEQGGSDEGRYPLPITCLLGLQVSFF